MHAWTTLHILVFALSIYVVQANAETQAQSPHHYIIEADMPPSNIVLVNETFTIRIWPKSEQKENITVAASQIAVVPTPRENITIKRINNENINVFTLEITATEPQNPITLYFVEQQKLIGPPVKLGAIEEGKICYFTSKAETVVSETTVFDHLEFFLDLREAYGQPTVQGIEHVKFKSSVTDIKKLKLQRAPNKLDEQPNIIRFYMNISEPMEFTLNITYREKPVSGCPLHFTVHPGKIDIQNSRILGFGSWLAELQKPNSFYVQLLDKNGFEIINSPIPALADPQSTEEKTEPSSAEPPSAEDPTAEESVAAAREELNSKISLKAWNSRNKPIEELQYVVEYLGKSTWGVRYLLPLVYPENIFLGIYFNNSLDPFQLLPVYAQEPGFPYPPTAYKMLGPYPARSQLIEPAPSSISTFESNLRTYNIDQNGWLPADYTSLPVSDTDYRAELFGQFKVEEDGIYLLKCLGVEHYSIDVPLFRSGDVWNVHQLQAGTHTLQASVIAKRDWNFEFQCRFEAFTALKSYTSETIAPALVDGHLIGQAHVLLQNLHTDPITDLTVKLLAINDTSVIPTVSLANENLQLPPQQFTRLPIQIEFQEKPTTSLVVVIALYSPSLQSKTQISFIIQQRKSSQPFEIQFVDSDKTIQTAMVIPPSSAGCRFSSGCRVALVSASGGVSISSLAEQYPPMPNVWWLFPTGRSVVPYELGPLFESHSLSAIDGLFDFISQNDKFAAQQIDKNAIICVGNHFHGGKGSMLLANHNPDRVYGVSAASAWIKHSEPRLDEFSHPLISSVIRVAQLSEDVHQTTSNFQSVAFFAGSGYGDTAGYPWRLFYQQTLFSQENIETGLNSAIGPSYKKNATSAIRPTRNVLEFVLNQVGKETKQYSNNFTVSSWNPGVFKGARGIYISALDIPMQLATINVEVRGNSWVLNTSNTRAFELLHTETAPRAGQVLIDGVSSFMIDTTEKVSFVKENGKWKEQMDANSLRNMNQYGPVSRLYEKKLFIVFGTNAPTEVAKLYHLFGVYISNELVKQHQLQPILVADIEYATLSENEQANVFLLGGPQTNTITAEILQNTPVPLSYENGELIFNDCRLSCENEYSAMFLAPHGDHLAFVVSASSLTMMQSAISVLPLHWPYDAFPDFVLLDQTHVWKGGNGIFSTGYWDADWKFNPLASYHQCPTYIQPTEELCSTLW